MISVINDYVYHAHSEQHVEDGDFDIEFVRQLAERLLASVSRSAPVKEGVASAYLWFCKNVDEPERTRGKHVLVYFSYDVLPW